MPFFGASGRLGPPGAYAGVRPRRVGDGGAPATVIVTGLSSRRAAGSLTTPMWTVGAPLKWVTPSLSSSAQMRAGSTFRRQTWRPPTAVTAQVKHQPLQWNMGSVQRYTVSNPIEVVMTSPRALR